MTVVLDTDFHDDEPEVLNVLSILAINAFAFSCISLGAHVAGLPLWLSLLTGWLCGAAVTLVLVTLIVLFPVSALRRPAQLRASQPAGRDAGLPAWLEDARAEAQEEAARRRVLRSWQEDAAREIRARELEAEPTRQRPAA